MVAVDAAALVAVVGAVGPEERILKLRKDVVEVFQPVLGVLNLIQRRLLRVDNRYGHLEIEIRLAARVVAIFVQRCAVDQVFERLGLPRDVLSSYGDELVQVRLVVVVSLGFENAKHIVLNWSAAARRWNLVHCSDAGRCDNLVTLVCRDCS